MENKSPLVLCDNLVKIYKIADLEVVALQGLDLEVQAGEIMALVGPSGAGKSTLLNVIGGLDTPSAGRVEINGWDLLQIKGKERVTYKKEVVGFVWQQTARNLLPYLTARENVELPMIFLGHPEDYRKKRALELLDIVNLSDRVDFLPEQLSGGQQQRVALAVALSNNPPLLIGDEVTGQIDSESASQVFESLRRINQEFNTTVILVTHDPLVSGLVDRVVAIRDGRTSTEIRRRWDEKSGDIHEEEWVILDQAGRLQLPKPYLETLNMRERVKVRLEAAHITVWPEQKVKEFIRLGAPEIQSFLDNEKTKNQTDGPVVTTKNLKRRYQIGVEDITAIDDVSLEIPIGKISVIKGRSGSGKTTLLNLIAGLDEPTDGQIYFRHQNLGNLNSNQKVEMRRKDIGFIFQTFGLLSYLSVRENVEIPLRLVHYPRKERDKRVTEVLSLVGLTGRSQHRTYELSGGEQQRVAIARALVNRPSLILADEPTGQLDSATGAGIIRLLQEITEETGVTVIIASHDPHVWEAAHAIFELQDGRLVGSKEDNND